MKSTDSNPFLNPALMIPEWRKYWDMLGMPEFIQGDDTAMQTIQVHFRNHIDRELFGQLVKQRITNKTRFVWYPEVRRQSPVGKKMLGGSLQGKYPVYVISKGRAKTPITTTQLSELGIRHFLVVEPQELEQYQKVINPNFCDLLPLPHRNYGGGCSIPARNWCWKDARDDGFKRHWILDDNIFGFYKLNDNAKVKVTDHNPFPIIEHFVDAFTNIGIAGLQYESFAPKRAALPAYRTNTRVYSCLLIDNSLPFEWRGHYNEDTDLCLRVLKTRKLCTVLFNAYQAKKMATMTYEGGNTDELYKMADNFDGRLEMAKELARLHPDLVEITHKWGRYQHTVDYSGFTQKLILRK